MNIIEIGKLLAVIGAVDRRQEAGKAEILAWHDLLKNVGYRDAETAVRTHRVESTDWLTATHVLKGVKRIQRGRLDRVRAEPNDVPGVASYDEQRALVEAIADGRMDEAGAREYTASGCSLWLESRRQLTTAGARVVRGELA